MAKKWIFLFAFAAQAWAQNYMSNGQFAQNLDDWTLEGMGIAHQTEGYPKGGALKVHLSDSEKRTISQCGAVVDSNGHRFAMWLKGTPNIAFDVSVRYFEGSDCQTLLGTEDLFSDEVPANSDWIHYPKALEMVPVGTIGMELQVTLRAVVPGDTIQISALFLGRFAYPGSNRGYETVIREGDVIPNTNGEATTILGQPSLTPNGIISFVGREGIFPSFNWLWYDTGVMWLEDKTDPYSGLSLVGPGANETGAFGFKVFGDGSQDVLLTDMGAVLREDDPVPGAPERVIATFLDIKRPPDGGLFARLHHGPDDQGEGDRTSLIQTDSITTPNYTTLLESGSAIDGETIDNSRDGIWRTDLSSNGLHYAATVLLTGGESALALDGNLVQRSTPLGETNRTPANFDFAVVNNESRFLTSGTLLDQPGQSIWSSQFGLNPIAEDFVSFDNQNYVISNQTIAGIDLLEPCNTPRMRINNAGQALLGWECRNQFFLFFIADIDYPMQTAHLILQGGDLLDTDNNGVSDSVMDSTGSFFNNGFDLADDGTVAILVSLDSLSPSERAILKWTAPCVADGSLYENIENWPTQNLLSFLPFQCE